MPLFKQIKLTTPESVELELTLAGLGSRAFALFLDYQVLGLSLALFWLVWSLFATQLLDYLDRLNINYSRIPLWLLAIALLISFFLYTGYFVLFEVFWQGQTPGKRVAKIRVIRDDGRPVRLAQAALRALLRPIDDFAFIGVLFIFFGKQEKRIGDWVAGTLVIQELRSQPQKLILSEAAQQLATQLPQLTDLAQLQSDDFAIINEYLHRREGMAPKARSELSLKLAREIRSIVQLAEIPPGLTSDQFLEAIYLAYQQHFLVPDLAPELAAPDLANSSFNPPDQAR